MSISTIFYRLLRSVAHVSVRRAFLQSNCMLWLTLWGGTTYAQESTPINSSNAETEENWEDNIQGNGPWIAIIKKESKNEYLNGGIAYIGFSNTGTSGSKSYTTAQAIQPAPDNLASSTISGLNANLVPEGLVITFTEHASYKKPDFTFYDCRDLTKVERESPGYENKTTYTTEVLLYKSGEATLVNSEKHTISEHPASSNVLYISSGDKTREEFIASLRNYIDENTEIKTSDPRTPNFYCEGFGDEIGRISHKAEVIQIFSLEQGCTDEPPSCSNGDEPVRFRFGSGTFGCYNPEAS
ncbi:MAG: hypothetical protein AAF734_04230, partial [Bacteroidota bacterium]